MGVGTVYLHNGKQKLLRFVQPRQDLVFGDGDGLGTLGASLHLDKPKAGFAAAQLGRDDRFHIVAHLLGTHIPGQVTERPLQLHHRIYGGKLDGTLVTLAEQCGLWSAHQLPEQPTGQHQRTAHHHRRGREDELFRFQFRKPLLHPGGKLFCPACRHLGVEPGVGFTCGFLLFQVCRPEIPVLDLGGQAFFHGFGGLIQQLLFPGFHLGKMLGQ